MYIYKTPLRFLMKLLLLFLLLSVSRQVEYERIFSTAGHTDMVVTASFFADNQRMITGSNDYSFKVWSLINFSVLHTVTYGDIIMNIGLHPTDNRIFVLVFDGNIYVYDPVSYSPLQTITYVGPNPNYMVFDTINNKFIVGGLQAGGIAPKIHFYDSTSYAHLSQITTTMPAGDEVNTISINVQNTHIAVTNLDLLGNNVAYLQFYNLNTNTLINSFTFNTNPIKWAIYDNSGSYLCSTFSDQSIKCYTYNSGTNMYVLDKNWNIASLSLGYPYCLNFGITNQLIVTSSPNIVFFDMLATPNPTKLLSYADAEDIFVLDSNSNMQYLVTGGRHGQVGLWKQKPQNNNNNQNIPVVQNSNSNLGLIIGLSVGIPVFFIILLVIYCCCFGACKRWRQSKLQNNQQLKIQDAHEITQNQLNSFLVPFQLQDKYIIIRGDDNDKNSQPYYDQLMAEGTIIIIKDEEKKKQYMKKLNKNRKKKHNMKENGKQDSSISSLDRKQLQIEGHIIIIRDNQHSIKNKMKNNNEQPDYNQLMAEENIIIIRDEEIKKKLVKKLQENKLNLKEKDFNYIMAEETIIVIKDSQEQKKFIKQLMKENDLKKIKHDQILANGDMIIIKDGEKKKQFVNSIKTEINKNNQKDIDYRALEIAEQIIIIRGDDDVNDTDEYTYEQLLAQGTVIVIRDEQLKNEYIKHKKQNSNNDQYSMMMAEQCIIVIRENDDKQDYVNFIKKRNNATEKSSSVDYDELMNGNAMTIKEQQKIGKNKKNSLEKKISKNIESDPNYKQIVAQRNIIAINQDPYLIKVQKYGEYQITYEGPRQSQKEIDQIKGSNATKNDTLLMPSEKIEKK